ncbi:hypothetical protein JF544_18130 [Halobacillus kuroshimensis]|uniref:CBS domain-containing protein n=1 Tax=Halobacillus kuroshimensis TaxID=302481 RepID=A0ABS3E0N4_9BACI|nr:DUF294 nucleotidyltransferase-like domain-containing protein [Halobacillus kuroshimensis]MBN8237168.1 hypothetical protein [Halobacillus kuroshimensis]
MYESYEDLRIWRDREIPGLLSDSEQLNLFHDQLISRTMRLAEERVKREQGNPPAPYAFYLMGSAGRCEQSIWSDQDHGLIFAGGRSEQDYFLVLGAEIKRGLAAVGYDECEGGVMSSNPLWCLPEEAMKQQVSGWLQQGDWQALRHMQIFFDSRVLIGEKDMLTPVKNIIFSTLKERNDLYQRLIENVRLIKKGRGVFGQLLPEQKGSRQGSLDLKQTIYFPFVNAARLLAFYKQLHVPSTLSRYACLEDDYPALRFYKRQFSEFLQFRLQKVEKSDGYDHVHYIPVQSLNPGEKKQLKAWMKYSHEAFEYAGKILSKAGVL